MTVPQEKVFGLSLTVVIIMNAIFLDVTPCNMVYHQTIDEKYCLHLEGEEARTKKVACLVLFYLQEGSNKAMK
jgi:hypothetical protein